MKRGGNGWELNKVSVIISKKGGAVFRKKPGYYFDDYFWIFNKVEGKVEYRCCFVPRENKLSKDEEIINSHIENLNMEDFKLTEILHPGWISMDKHYSAAGSGGHILIFLRK